MGATEFNELLFSHLDFLKRLAFTWTRDREAAKDLCQETLCRALHHRHRYVHSTNPAAWLHTIMRRIFINEYRRNARKRQILTEVSYKTANNSATSNHAMELKEVQKAVHKLPIVSRTACLMYLHGYRYQEIAVSLNEPLGTIKSRIHTAKKILEKQINS